MALQSIVIIILTLSLVIEQSNADLINTFVVKNVHLDSQVVKVYTDISFINPTNYLINKYTYLMDSNIINYHIKFTNHNGVELFFDKQLISHGDKYYNAFDVKFPVIFTKDEENLLKIEEIHVNKVMPVLKKKKFDEPDFVEYSGNVMYTSIYKTKEMSADYHHKNLESISIPAKLKTDTLSHYGFVKIKPFSFKEIVITYIFDKPLFHVLNLNRFIEVSHFGRIIITEDIEIKNTGAKVYGPFKATKFNKKIYTHLPASAENVQLYDELGAKYDWNVIEFDDYKTLKFETRYPLYNGWKTMYTLKYSVPTYEYLRQINTSYYELEMRLVDHVLNDVVIDNLKTKIVLPEKSRYYYSFVPLLYFKQEPDESTITLLSCYGRPTVVFAGNSIVEDHIDNFIIQYYYNPIYLLRVPLKLSFFIYIIFIFIIFGRRLVSLKI